MAIAEPVIKQYPAMTVLVQSSVEPIELGQAMLQYMETQALRDWMEQRGIASRENWPLELYLYNWVERAQGPMIFDVGYVVDDATEIPDGDHGYLLKRYPAVKVASITYRGPFPYEEGSGWGRLDWEGRSKRAGHVYTERLYRELYHHYDWQDSRHITEIQLAVE